MSQEIAPLSLEPEIGLALDMAGCPNRCRHCYLGPPRAGRPTVEDLREIVKKLRNYKKPGDTEPFWKKIHVSAWLWEPDYSDDYKELYALENELSGLPSLRASYELLSAWRLARDEGYAKWAYEIGVRACQLTFFGLEETTDWFIRRRGAFKDLLVATERLLEAGIRPRWQLFFTQKMLPDLPGLLKLAEDLRLRERCEALGGEFRLFMHCAGPGGSALEIEHLRPTIDDLKQVPEWLRDNRETRSEAEILPELLKDDKPMRSSLKEIQGPCLFFLIGADYTVCPNAEGWVSDLWKIGNIKDDDVETIVDNLENCRAPGLEAMFRVPTSELAKRFGRPDNRQIHAPGDLKERWVNLWAQEEMAKS